jgi:hypothetical protein
MLAVESVASGFRRANLIRIISRLSNLKNGAGPQTRLEKPPQRPIVGRRLRRVRRRPAHQVFFVVTRSSSWIKVKNKRAGWLSPCPRPPRRAVPTRPAAYAHPVSNSPLNSIAKEAAVVESPKYQRRWSWLSTRRPRPRHASMPRST